jgi:hypothetical protein
MTPEEIRECEELQVKRSETGDSALGTLQADVNRVRLLTLGSVREQTVRDDEVSGVTGAIKTGIWHQELGGYRRVKLSLCVAEGVVLYRDMIVMPRSLQREVLATLHSGHQGVSSMLGRAGQSVWWPGMGRR